MTSLNQHVKEIKEWINEACADNPEVNPIDVECDVVTSYISAYTDGESSPMAQSIRRRFGSER